MNHYREYSCARCHSKFSWDSEYDLPQDIVCIYCGEDCQAEEAEDEKAARV
jgi:DNA-directed RNA polymerase subunit RPC12/RpoP